MDNKNKLQIFVEEYFKELELENELKFRYAISNFGRLVSFTKEIEHGRIVNGSITEGYRIFRYRIRTGQKIFYRHKFFHRLVAENFLEKTSDEQTFVLHLDHNLANDVATNLKWATKQEMLDHQRKNPKVIKARKLSTKRIVAYVKKRDGYKLSTEKVISIKRLLANPKRKTLQKVIAKRFGISEMQLYRIKSGENWAHVKIDGKNRGKKVRLTQKPKTEPTKKKSEEKWNEKLQEYQNGKNSVLIRRWISDNRKLYKEGKLPKEKVEKLMEINFSFDAAPKVKKSNSWDRLLEEWKKGNRKSLPLQQWKRRSIRRFLAGKLSKDRIAKLMGVGILK